MIKPVFELLSGFGTVVLDQQVEDALFVDGGRGLGATEFLNPNKPAYYYRLIQAAGSGRRRGGWGWGQVQGNVRRKQVSGHAVWADVHLQRNDTTNKSMDDIQLEINIVTIRLPWIHESVAGVAQKDYVHESTRAAL